jgi:arylsulfatase A-like enzyme/Flp pilus assembly protein TadD
MILKNFIRAYLFLLGGIALTVSLSGELGNSFRKDKTPLNLLLITIDTLRADRLSCYSKEHLSTPNIDSLANRGVLFTRAFAHTSTTLPSHANILLGTTPLSHGVHDNSNFIVRPEFTSIAEYLKAHGYSTAAFVGAYPLDSRFGVSQGFDLYDDDYDIRNVKTDTGGERIADIVVDRALEWLKEQNTPWFLWIHCWDPHDPYEPPEPFKTKFSKNPYDGEVAYVDHVLGRLFEFLKKNKLWENSLVILTGDHGESLWDHDEETHGIFAYNSTIWIPLIIHAPGTKSRRVDQNVSHVDIFPTVCDVLEIDKPDFCQGVSLLPALRGKKIRARPIYFESLYPYYSRSWAPLTGYIDKDEKFMESPVPELYNLKEDFEELHNLAEDKKLDSYQKKLDEIVQESAREGSQNARQKLDRRVLERLRSLGYINDSPGIEQKTFGPEHDVKVLIRYHNKSVEATSLFNEDRTEDAIRLLKEIITERKDIGIAYKILADIYDKEDRINDALLVLKEGLEAVPSYYENFYSYVTLLMSLGRYDEVISAILENRLLKKEIDPEIWNFLGLAYWNKGHFSEAQRAYERSISLDKKYAVAYNNLATLHLYFYKERKDPSEYDTAIGYFKEAIALDPFYSEAYQGLGIAYLGTQRYNEAVGCFEEILKLRPDDVHTMLYLGLSFRGAGNLSDACEYFSAVKSSPSFHLLSPADKARLESAIRDCPPTKR